MDKNLKIIVQLPLRELWRDDGFKSNGRGRPLTQSDIVDLLRTGQVHFVVADAGSPPLWISVSDCHRFWKDEVRSHLAADSKVHLHDFPGAYCYFASQWGHDTDGTTIVVLEKSH